MGRDFPPVQIVPGTHPASCTMGTGPFPGVRRPGRGINHPPPSSAEAKETVEQYLYYLSWPSLLVLGRALPYLYSNLYDFNRGPGSSVGIATELRAGRSGDRIPVGRDFPTIQTGTGAHPASCTMGTGSFPGVKYGRGVLLTTHPLLMP